MKKVFTGISAAVMLSALCLAQQTTPPATGSAKPGNEQAQSATAQSTASPRIAPGSVIPVQLTKTIDAKKAKSGDEVAAKVTQDLKNNSGEVIVAKDTKVVGHITEAQVRTKEDKESQLGIAFDHAVMNGTDVSMPMSIQAVIAPPRMGANNSGGEYARQPAGSPSMGGPTPGNAGGQSPGAERSPRETGSYPSGGDQTSNPSAGTSASARQEITANTQGVVGNPDLSLSSSGSEDKGSVVSSQKSNVKLESGTLLLLRVNQ